MSRQFERLGTGIALAFVMWLYWWTVSTVGGLGPPSKAPAFHDYYNHLVAGFVQGHLHMDMAVADELKTLPDPYDPKQNERYRRTDASYFNGRYYLYFGAAPAVTLLWPYRLITGEFLPTPWAILIFCWIGFLAGVGIWLALCRRYFDGSSWWVAPLGVLTLGIGNTAAVVLRRPFFWELASAGGLAFTMLGVAAIYAAIHAERRGWWFMAASGLCLGLAVASRPTFVFATPILLVPLVLRRTRQPCDRVWWTMALGGATGLGAMAIAVLAYNYARFGNPFETGHNYLLSIAYESKVRLFSLGHVLFNARMYYLLPGAWSWHPPFFAPIPVTREEMPPDFYTVDDPFGLLPVFPVAALSVMAGFAMRGRTPEDRQRLFGTLGATVGLFAAGSAVILSYVATIPRYAVDFMPALALLAAVGLATVLRLVRENRWRRPVAAAVLAVAVYSVFVGTLALFDVGRLLGRSSPEKLAVVTDVTRRIEAAIDEGRKIHFGPITLRVTWSELSVGKTETLLLAGKATQPDRVLVEYLDTAAIRIGVQPAHAPVQWGSAIPIRPNADHTINIDLGSFYPPLEHRFFAAIPYHTASKANHRVKIAFDGKLVLDAYGPFVPTRHGAPNAAAPGFSGHVSAIDRTPPTLAETSAHPELIESPGGVLRLQVLLPRGRKGAWVPFVAAGAPGAADALSINYMEREVIQFRFDHWGAPLVVGELLSIDENVPHTIDVYFPSFARGTFGQPAQGEAWVRIDGREALRASTATFGFRPDDLALGQNAVGATMDDCYFRGVFIRGEWVAPP